MKTIIKSALLAAILIAAPAHATFKHMGKAFRTAVMNRSLSTQPSLFASIHNGRRPLTTFGALIGLGSTGYAMHQAGKQFAKSEESRKLKQYAASAYKDRDFICTEDPAEFTRMALMIEDNPTPQSENNFWIHTRALSFNYCQKHKKMSREEIYHQNINHAHDTALQWKTKDPGLAPYIVRNFNVQEWRTRNSQRYEKTAHILERDWQEEQETQRKQAQRIKELEMLTWLHFA